MNINIKRHYNCSLVLSNLPFGAAYVAATSVDTNNNNMALIFATTLN